MGSTVKVSFWVFWPFEPFRKFSYRKAKVLKCMSPDIPLCPPSVLYPQQKPNSADGEGTQRLCLSHEMKEDHWWDARLAALPHCYLPPWLRCCGCSPGRETSSSPAVLASIPPHYPSEVLHPEHPHATPRGMQNPLPDHALKTSCWQAATESSHYFKY